MFRNEEARSAFAARRVRCRSAQPRIRKSDLLYEEHREVLNELMVFLTERGRLPDAAEAPDLKFRLGEVIGSTRQAFALIKRVTGVEEWEAIRAQKSQELLIYLALAGFDGRPMLSRLPRGLQLDVKAFFTTYKHALEEADRLLYSMGDGEAINKACKASAIGKLTPTALYVHESAFEELAPVLKVYEGCARNYIGRLPGANIIKLHRGKPAISYLCYPTFESDPHPALTESVRVRFDTRDIKWQSFENWGNPPILHRKDAFVLTGHPLREKFVKLTAQEERTGLFDDTSTIGNLEGWNAALAARGVKLWGHRLVRATPAGSQ